MSRNRKRVTDGYHYDGSAKITHPDGRPSCRWCKGSVPFPRRTYCSDPCVHEWRLRTNPGYLRSQVWQRDRGICALCGVDAEAKRAAQTQAVRAIERKIIESSIHPRSAYYDIIRTRALAGAGLSRTEVDASAWQADHITPVSEGGGECGLDNLRTLCTDCHQNQTTALAGRLAAQKRTRTSADHPLFRHIKAGATS